MEHKAISIRPFIGARDFNLSRSFYRDLGFEDIVITPDFSLFEVDNVERFWNELTALNLTDKYEVVKLTPPRSDHWGKECFVHDPSGILWHFGEFFHKH